MGQKVLSKGVITLLINMIGCCIIAIFLFYNDAKIMSERNRYFEIDPLKDTRRLEFVDIIVCVLCIISF